MLMPVHLTVIKRVYELFVGENKWKTDDFGKVMRMKK